MERKRESSEVRPSREDSERKKVWLPPERLPNFKDKVPGYHLRWVRYTLRGERQDDNVLSRIRQGYEPVMPEEIGVYNLPTMEDGKFAGAVVSGDLILMKVPEEIAEQRNEYFRKKSASQQKAIDEELNREDRREMPLNRSVRSNVSVGRPHFKEE